MRTVKEISEITGISVRTLHYYDEIGLFQPTDKSEAGYRLYDDKANGSCCLTRRKWFVFLLFGK